MSHQPVRPAGHRPIHPERTGDPAVIRWVVHHPLLAASPSGPRRPSDGALRALIEQGAVVGVQVVQGDVLVRADDAARWRSIADRVRAALLDALDALDAGTSSWLTESVGAWDDLPSITDVQAEVDRAAGAVMTMHGGTIVVTAIEPPVVRVIARGACHGCSQSDTTLLDLITPALRRLHPALERIVLDDTAAAAQIVAAPRLLGRAPRGGSCH